MPTPEMPSNVSNPPDGVSASMLQNMPDLNFAPTQITLHRPSVGRSPSGFPRLHVEMSPREVGRLIGYDPRAIVVKPTKKPKKDVTPHNVSMGIVELQNRVQRSIDNSRVRLMVEYLRSAMDTGTFADWGAIELVTANQPDFSQLESHHVIKMDAHSDYFIADGQHRYCAILDFVREFPQYSERFTQALTISILPSSKLGEWAGQAFHDRNYFAEAVRAGKALAVDSRDPINSLTKALADHPVIKHSGGIAYERDTLLKGDPRFTTHTVLNRFVRGFLYGRGGIDKGGGGGEVPSEAQRKDLSEYISALGEIIPWDSEIPERDQYLARASVIFAGLAVAGHDLYNSGMPKEEMFLRLQTLGKLDWRRSNLAWAGVAGTEKDGVVQPASSRPAIDATIKFFRDRLGLQNVLKKETEEKDKPAE
jgi:hypothetical protein